uniref:Uncharacterized protein n=1 Tax=mine drainage metagenome TaxID=410659 RepID=E6QMG7_9ZZZZ
MDSEDKNQMPDTTASNMHRPPRLRHNVSITIVARLLYMVTRVGIPPFVLARIGLEAYGIWTTIFILVTYLGLTTLGISNVYIKYVAEFHARREYHRANSLLSTGLAITVPLCSVIFAGIWLGWRWIAPLLHLPASHAADGKEAVLIVVGIFLSSIAFSVFSDALTGIQEIAANQYFWTISFVVEFVLILILVGHGRGIRGLAEAYLARTIIEDGLKMWWAIRKLPWLRLSWRLASRESLRAVIHFGGLVQFQSLLTICLNSIERVLALLLVNVSAAGLMDLAKKWPQSLSSVPTAFFAAFLPAASHLDASSDEESKVRNLGGFYLRGARYSNLCTAFFCAMMAMWSYPIMHVWLGIKLPMPGVLVPLFVAFSISMQFHMLTGPGTSILRGIGKVWEEFYYSVPNILFLAVTVPLSYLYLHAWTTLGIGIAVAVATVCSACVLMTRVLFALHVSLADFLRLVIAPGLVPYLASALLAWPVWWSVMKINRWSGMAVLMVAGLLYSGMIAGLLGTLFLRDDEKAQLRKLLLRLKGRSEPSLAEG